ncbi:hypothetical protein SAMN05216201_11882 [Pseudomonas linyingensis]|uniref:DUF6285 domain-containing protein n=1 Tax=Pseudomonas linyingensis TaxID=915471 RepID=A0A1H7BQI1_9PSED|nr:DUF6285 domain-containing protein [Pseudomonas linyingensis]SEJ79943.1 hypothetical protein SAMN05216201_11882 [Pseudomonas linyingensis]
MNQPDARDLLATARDLLLKQLLPALPASLHYEARMITSAMAIATREIELAAACTQAEVAALARVLDLHGQAESSLAEARAQVARNIRAGLYDERGAARERLLDALLTITREQLRISNPKVVAHD